MGSRSYLHTLCGIDGWGYLFNVFDVFTREWVGYCFDLSAVKENAIISVENALVTHKDIVPQQDLVIRTDNGSHSIQAKQSKAKHLENLYLYWD